MKVSRWISSLAVALAVVNYVPELLMFPHHKQIGLREVYSDAPVDPNIEAVLRRTSALIAAGPISDTAPRKRLFLTNGGWRWRMLAPFEWGAFALSRPLSTAMIFNRSDIRADRVSNGRAIGGTRTLSGTIAHETVHLLLGDRYGPIKMAREPTWKVEGFADYVSRESSLSDADAAKIRASGGTHPALVYYDGRRRVAQVLANGGSVDTLFALD